MSNLTEPSEDIIHMSEFSDCRIIKFINYLFSFVKIKIKFG